MRTPERRGDPACFNQLPQFAVHHVAVFEPRPNQSAMAAAMSGQPLRNTVPVGDQRRLGQLRRAVRIDFVAGPSAVEMRDVAMNITLSQRGPGPFLQGAVRFEQVGRQLRQHRLPFRHAVSLDAQQFASLDQVGQHLAAHGNVHAGINRQHATGVQVAGIVLWMLKTQTGTALRVKDIAIVTQGPKIRLGHMARANHMEDGRIIDEPDVIQGRVLLRKGAEEEPTLEAIHKKVDELNNGLLPPGVKVVPMLDRTDLLHFTLHTVMHNLVEGMILVTVILFLFLLNARAALIVALTIPFSLLFASIFLNLSSIPANLLSLGALDFGMVVDGAVVMVENIMRHLSHARRQTSNGIHKTTAEMIREACHEVQRPVFYAIAIIITAYLPIFTLQRVEGRLFRPMAWTVAFALLGAMTFSILIAPVLASHVFP